MDTIKNIIAGATEVTNVWPKGRTFRFGGVRGAFVAMNDIRRAGFSTHVNGVFVTVYV